MPLISDPSNTRSNFPFTLDVFTNLPNGTGTNSTIDGEIWNKIESAIYRIQQHTQNQVLFFDSADRKRMALSGTVFISPAASGGTGFTLVFDLTGTKLSFISNQLQRFGVMPIADVVNTDGTADCTTNVQINSTGVLLSVIVNRTDPTQPILSGTYVVRVCLLGF